MKNKRNKSLILCLLLCFCLMFSGVYGCGTSENPSGTTVSVTGVTLDTNSITLTVGGELDSEQRLTATVAPADASNKLCSWSSSAPLVASVNAAGRVKAESKGTATITVTTRDGGKSDFCVVTVNESSEPQDDELIAYAEEITEFAEAFTADINGKFFVKGASGNNYFYEAQDNKNYSYLWGVFGAIGMQYRLVKLNPDDAGAKSLYKDMLDALKYYRKPISATVVKYCSGRGDKTGNATNYSGIFFDDNIWVARNFLYAYEIFGEAYYLNEAKYVTNFIYTGWNNEIGGLVWNEAGLGEHGTSDDNERGLSANACGIIVNAMLYDITKDSSYLEWAEKFYEFCKRVQDPETYFYYNGIHTIVNGSERKDGTVNQARFSYNPGSMLIADVLMYEITNDDEYLVDLGRAAKAGNEYFEIFSMSYNCYFYNDDQWFNAILMEGFLYAADYIDVRGYVDVFKSFFTDLRKTAKNSYGLFTPNIRHNIQTGNNDNMLLTQSGLAEQLCLIAVYYNSLVNV